MTGGAAAGVGPWKPLCFPFARGRQLLRRRCTPFSDAGEAPVGRFSLHPCILVKRVSALHTEPGLYSRV